MYQDNSKVALNTISATDQSNYKERPLSSSSRFMATPSHEKDSQYREQAHVKKYYDKLLKQSSTCKKLQTIQTVALENELKFSEKKLFHNLKKNAGHDFKLKKYL